MSQRVINKKNNLTILVFMFGSLIASVILIYFVFLRTGGEQDEDVTPEKNEVNKDNGLKENVPTNQSSIATKIEFNSEYFKALNIQEADKKKLETAYTNLISSSALESKVFKKNTNISVGDYIVGILKIIDFVSNNIKNNSTGISAWLSSWFNSENSESLMLLEKMKSFKTLIIDPNFIEKVGEAIKKNEELDTTSNSENSNVQNKIAAMRALAFLVMDDKNNYALLGEIQSDHCFLGQLATAGSFENIGGSIFQSKNIECKFTYHYVDTHNKANKEEIKNLENNIYSHAIAFINSFIYLTTRINYLEKKEFNCASIIAAWFANNRDKITFEKSHYKTTPGGVLYFEATKKLLGELLEKKLIKEDEVNNAIIQMKEAISDDVSLEKVFSNKTYDNEESIKKNIGIVLLKQLCNIDSKFTRLVEKEKLNSNISFGNTSFALYNEARFTKIDVVLKNSIKVNMIQHIIQTVGKNISLVNLSFANMEKGFNELNNFIKLYEIAKKNLFFIFKDEEKEGFYNHDVIFAGYLKIYIKKAASLFGEGKKYYNPMENNVNPLSIMNELSKSLEENISELTAIAENKAPSGDFELSNEAKELFKRFLKIDSKDDITDKSIVFPSLHNDLLYSKDLKNLNNVVVRCNETKTLTLLEYFAMVTTAYFENKIKYNYGFISGVRRR